MVVFAGLEETSQPAGSLTRHCSSIPPNSVSLSHNQSVSAKILPAERGQYMQVPTSAIPEQDDVTSHVHLTTNSIMGAINSHTVRAPTCLWASIVLRVPRFTIPSEHGETPHMPLGINSICRYRHLPYLKKATQPPHASDILQWHQ